jgi:hypothetical protein
MVFWMLLSPAVGPAKDGRDFFQSRSKTEMTMFLAAAENYQRVYGCYPSGSASNVVRLLLGDNPQKLRFLVAKPSARGELNDPWGTPYQIFFEPTNHVSVRSAGKNRVFGDKDDLEQHIPDS